MGWSFGFDADRKRFIERITSKSHFNVGFTPIESRVNGNRVWQLVRHDETGRTFITLDLIAKERNGGWGYKGMSEDMGPCYYDCPLSLLDKAGEPIGEYAAAWREKVRAHHAKKKTVKATLAAGMVVSYGGHHYRLQFPAGPRKGWHVTRVSDGLPFRMKATQLNQAFSV